MFSTFAIVPAIAVTLTCVYAQSISDVPHCAVCESATIFNVVRCPTKYTAQAQAAYSSISSTGCQIQEIACICKDQSFVASLLPVVEKACSPADLQSELSPI